LKLKKDLQTCRLQVFFGLDGEDEKGNNIYVSILKGVSQMNVGLLTAWRFWDSIYYQFTRLQYVDKESGNIFRIVVLQYEGSPIQTSDGVEIRTGDMIARLHIHNCRLAHLLRGIDNENRMVMIVLREIKRSLPRLAQVIVYHPKFHEIKGLIGTTMLHRGARPMGFDVADMEAGMYQRFKTVFLKTMLTLFHPEGMKRLKRKPEHLVPKKVFISVDELLRRYGNHQSPSIQKMDKS
jgi:hypothetical protein